MSPTVAVTLLWLGFAGSHMGLSSRGIRPWLVARLGPGGFLALYSLVSFAFFVPLVWTYFANKHAGPLLWSVPVGSGLRWVIYAGMAIAFVLVVAGLVRPSPAGMIPGDPTPRGALRITRHPLFMGFGIFGLLHLIPNGHAADVAFFAGFPLFAIVGCRHQDQRKLADGPPGYREFHRETPFLPFTGPATAQGIREMGPLLIALGVGVTLLLRWIHPSWFGGGGLALP
jgi:uncharacterized membrane protein